MRRRTELHFIHYEACTLYSSGVHKHNDTSELSVPSFILLLTLGLCGAGASCYTTSSSCSATGSKMGKAGVRGGDAQTMQSSLFSFINPHLHSIIIYPSPYDVTGKWA